MGWKCSNCGNTELFIEINKVETLVSQEKNTTRIKKVINKYMDNPLIEVKCDVCMSKHVIWVNLQAQDDSYIFEHDDYITENHTINTIALELTNKCNINCLYCPKQGNEELDLDLIKKVSDENIKIKHPVKHFELGWDAGNPLLHSKIKDIISLFNNSDYRVNILTNGKDFQNKVKELNLTKNLSFTFFLDHPIDEENDKLMGKDVFSDTLKAFSYLKRKSISFNVYMRLSRYNYDKVEEMNKLVKRHGANSLVPTEVYPLGKTNDDMLMDDEMKQKAMDDIERLGLHRSVHFSPALPHSNCTYQRKMRLFINSKGKLSFCHFLSSLRNSEIVDVKGKSLLELMQINNKIRNGFLKNKEKLFAGWKKPRFTASPCSYCIHVFGLNKKW